jgi:CHAT domain-containing protein
VPHGPLHYLPFAALRDPESGRYLVESYELTLLPSASVLLHLRGKESPVEGRALVLGSPETADPDLSELDGARAEAEEVAALLGVEPLLGGAATEGRVRAAAGGVDFLHVAAHGIYQPRNPRFSRLALAADDGHDGNLEAHEVFSSLDLWGVNLVVLSACQTAVGPDAGGDEIVSLARAFLHAGSPGVVSTLWPVDDGVSAELMTAFYQRLLAGERASAALRGAQLELLRSGRPAPYHWAGYTLTGDPGPVRVPRGGSR